MNDYKPKPGDRVITRTTGQRGRVDAVGTVYAHVWMPKLGEHRDIPLEHLVPAGER